MANEEAKKEPKPTGHEGHAHAEEKAKPKPAAAKKAEGEAKTPAKPKPAPEAEAKPEKTTKAPKGDSKKEEAKAPAKKPAKREEPVKIVEKPTPRHVPQAKPVLSKEQRAALGQRRAIDNRRPRFRRQQWYEYKRLANSGWRRPNGVDSSMRRHFGHEQSVVRVGFAGPKAVRGLHPSGFREVYVARAEELKGIDPKTQAARVSGTLGSRKLKLLYAEADKLGVRVLNRRNLQ